VDEVFRSTLGIVERAIASFGVDPNGARVDGGDAHAAYSLMRGSALTLVSVLRRDEEVVVRVACPVMTLPDELTRPALFQRLLELNAGAVVGSAAFALSGERVVVVSERPAAGLDDREAAHMIARASAVADTFDDRLVREFGGKRASDARSA
jgi:hypothetical protein